MNIPKLRFPEFTGEWEIKKLEEMTEKIGDGLHGTPIYAEDSDIYFINGNNLTNGKIEINENTKKVEEHIFEKNNKGLNKNTILISINGTIGNIAKYNNEKVMLGKSVGYFNFKENIDFYYHLFNTDTVQNFFISELTGSTIKNLSLKTLRETKIFFPTIPEQKRIASFFTVLDKKIAELKQKKTLLEQYKKGIMQKLFSQELRFKDENGKEFPKWEKLKLGEISDVRDGTHDSPKYVDKGFPFITSKNLMKDGSIDFENVTFITEADYNKVNQRSKVNINDILFGMIGTIGNPVLVKSDGFAIKNVALIKEKKELLNLFLIHFLKGDAINKQFFEQNTGGTQKFLSLSIVRNLVIEIPSIQEQTKIANFLFAIDEKTNRTVNQIQQTQQYKKGLLQNMFV